MTLEQLKQRLDEVGFMEAYAKSQISEESYQTLVEFSYRVAETLGFPTSRIWIEGVVAALVVKQHESAEQLQSMLEDISKK